MSWRDLEASAQEIARLGRERLDQTRVVLLATLRKDGSPRISPVEPYLFHGDLLFGAMSWSLKTHDLLRDSRCTLHSAVTGPDNGEGELKLYGRAVEADDHVRDRCQGWWTGRPRGTATVFTLNIEQAAFVSWDTGRGQMIVRRWSPQRGYIESKRGYP
ncbi:MAG: pyridoxamine 5'-phosphate oxidase family protein [Gaiellaceae bacterium]